MNWYKYWYFTIYFIYDHFSKNAEDNKMYSIGFFTMIYMLFAIFGYLVNRLSNNIIVGLGMLLYHFVACFYLYRPNIIRLANYKLYIASYQLRRFHRR